MFFLIWRGWGIVVIPIAAVAFVLAVLLASFMKSLGVSDYLANPMAFTAASAGGAAAIWFLARALTGRNKRTLVDPATGQQYVFASNAGSLFFIPTRYWAFIVLAVGILFGLMMGLSPRTADTAPAQVSNGADVSQSSL